MTHSKQKWLIAGAAALAVAALAGCHDDHGGSSTTPPPASTQFSVFAKTVFAEGPDTVPINFDNVNLVYDVDDDPTAFDALLMM